MLSNRVYKVEDGLMFVQIYPTKWKVDLATLVSTLLRFWCIWKQLAYLTWLMKAALCYKNSQKETKFDAEVNIFYFLCCKNIQTFIVQRAYV